MQRLGADPDQKQGEILTEPCLGALALSSARTGDWGARPLTRSGCRGKRQLAVEDLQFSTI